MNQTKRLFAIILAFVFAIMAVVPMAMAQENCNGFERRDRHFSISPEDTEFMRSQLVALGLYGDGFLTEPLYDVNGEITFLLGTSECGFVIISRPDGILYEWGGVSPFTGFEACKKYYAGAMSYYVKNIYNNAFYNLMTAAVEESPTLRLIESPSQRGGVFDDPQPTPSKWTISNPQYITQYAFGYNSTGTCSAVAAGIALNYLKRQYGLPVTINLMTPEPFYSTEGFPKNYSSWNSLYPKAETLHQKLTHYCVNGWSINEPLNRYFTDWISDPAKRPIAFYDRNYNSFENIKQYILSNRPIIVCTYTHSMAAYGCCKVFSNNGTTYGVLVHMGWTGRSWFNHNNAVNRYEHIEHYINVNTLRALYSFILPSGC
ncbi:MAG: hypothetical protein IKZ82_01340 [Clostridia bacterium]|nr:hypothetical protein [Clostridia bacterium]